ncbi:MAG TPA: carbamoyltransferase N-terminal domain-containing protein, partial [Actinomycetota bacterium]|nr:carbamoyltransferase N-terminal domain-containing protein [Actinomycetota bacterium]
LQTYVAYAPLGLQSFSRAMPIWLRQKLHITRELHQGLDRRYNKRFVFCEHHESHAASAFFPSPFEEAAILTLDGVGEWTTGAVGRGTGNRFELLSEMRFPHSLGLLYSAFTYYCGFRVNSGEYKLMGLAPYGDPTYADLILEHLLDLKPDGSLRLDMSYFKYARGLTMTTRKFHDLFGGPPRSADTDLSQRDMDLAASIQKVTNEVVLRAGRFAHSATGSAKLCMAGGVALNCVSNQHLLENGPFDEIWIQPAAGDAGGALGAALMVWHQLLENPRNSGAGDTGPGTFLGPQFDDREVEKRLTGLGARYSTLGGTDAVCEAAAALLARGLVVGWFQDRMEFGPRALGSRSILGDPRDREMQTKLNLKIKFRESFRPFAPAVLAEHAAEWFDLGRANDSPYMLLVVPVSEKHRIAGEGETVSGLERLRQVRSDIPAVTHVDYSARLQTVDRRNGRFHDLLQHFYAKTGCPILINTSFNVRGEPIVCTPEDAYRCFMATGMDALVVGNCMLLKSEQPDLSDEAAAEHLKQFALD